MNKITDQLGAIFRSRFKDSLKKPLNWRMIDALSTLDEMEEEQRRQQRDDVGDAEDGHADKRDSDKS
jgi:hypothetical protein